MDNRITQSNASIPGAFAPFKKVGGVSYAIIKPLTAKQKREEKVENEKKSNALGYSIAVTALLAGFGVLAIMKGPPNAARRKVNTFLKYLDGKVAQLKKNKQLTNFQKFNISALEKLKTLTSRSRAIFSIATIKDTAVKASINKVPFLKKFGENITNLFEKISIRTSTSAYSRTSSNFENLYAALAETKINAKLDENQQLKLQKGIDSIKKIYSEYFSAEAVVPRLKETKSDFKKEGFYEKIRDKFFHVKELVTHKELYTSFIAEELASTAKNSLKEKVIPHRDEIAKEMEEILKIYDESSLPKNEFLKIQKQANNSVKSLKKSVNTETDKLFDKLRDLEIGSAPTDVLGVFTSMGIIGWGLTKADNKDERISVGLKYGIPALGAIMTHLYFTVKLVTAGKSLFLGLLSGAVINKIGAFVDNSRKKYNEHPVNLTTLPNIIKNPLSPTSKKAAIS